MNPESELRNINVSHQSTLPTPGEIRELFPLDQASSRVVLKGRQSICDILDRKDPRLFVVLGPCSIHDTRAALDYAERLKKLADRVADQLVLVMRVYFEKPRTTTGWKGLVNDPDLNDSFNIEKGLRISRELLLQLAHMGLPTATEALDPIVPQYLSDLISWTAIGARTTESQTHRELASGLSTPVGFKNGTDGNIQVAINAMRSALSSHSFLGINSQGRISVYKTKGNPFSHVVLRGGHQSNYDAASVAHCIEELEKAKLRPNVMIDCSHGNSNKQHERQVAVFEDVIGQVLEGNSHIVGMMVESNLRAGSQAISSDLSKLQSGVSVTDACIDWETTETMLLKAHSQLKKRS